MDSMDLDTFRTAVLQLVKNTNLFLSGVALVQTPSRTLLSASLGRTEVAEETTYPQPNMDNYDKGKSMFQRNFCIEGHPLCTVQVLTFKMENPDREASRWQLGFRN